MHFECADVVVIGGGVVGMTTALALGDAGRTVWLLEAGQMGQEASWAGGGIMMPLYAWRGPRQLDALLMRSLAELVQLVDRLKTCAGIDPEWNACGLWVRGLTPQECQEAQDWATLCGWPVALKSYKTWAGTCGLTLGEPIDTLTLSEDLWFPSVANIRNPRLLKGLEALLKQHPRITVSAFSPVRRVDREGDALSVVLESFAIRANDAVCAAGAWSTRLLNKSLLPGTPIISPTLGQMMLLQYEHDDALPMVLQNDRYIIPRKGGLVLVGSTVEYCGYQKKWDADAYSALLEFAVSLLGESVRHTVQAQWAGLRPDAGRDVPVIGPHPQVPGLWFNTGHFRNGLVLAAGSANYLTQCMREGWEAATQAENAFGVSLADRSSRLAASREVML